MSRPGRLASQAAVEVNGAASLVVAEEEECEGEAEDGYCSAQEFSCEEKEPAVDDLRDSRAEEPRKEQQAASPVITWQLVVGLVLRHKLRLVGLAVGLIAGTTCNVVLPRINGNFVQALVAPVPVPLAQLLLPIAAIYVLEPAATLLFVSSLSAVWESVMAAVRVRVFRRLLLQKVAFYDAHKVAALSGVLSSELAFMDKAVTDNVTRDRGLRSICEVVSTLAILFVIAPDLAPVFSLLAVGISLIAGIYKRGTLPVFARSTATQARITDSATETFQAIRTVRSFGGEARQLGRFAGHVAEARETGTRLSVLKSTNEALTRGCVYISLMCVYILGGHKVQMGGMAAGTVLAFVGYTFLLTFAIQGLVNTMADVQNALSAVARINALLSASPPEPNLSIPEPLPDLSVPLPPSTPCPEPAAVGVVGEAEEKEGLIAVQRGNGAVVGGGKGLSACELAWTGDIEFRDVRFAYPQRAAVEVIKGINLVLPRGTVTALVGGSGAGKSTVVQLLSRFYEPVAGTVSLAGEDIASFDRTQWTRAVSLVSQEPVLFAMSVRDNIAYGLPDADVAEADVIRAAKAANAHEFIVKLPQGYDTMVGERGGLLSGGQRQRLAIARAILKDAPILILDEATSALDSVSERLVQQALEGLMQGRTTLVIAHRLSTVQAADQIVVMAAGRLVERGTHAQLVAQGGAYATLVNAQHLTFESSRLHVVIGVSHPPPRFPVSRSRSSRLFSRFPRQTPPWAVPRRSPKGDDAERPRGAQASNGRGLRRASTERAATMDSLPSVLPLDAGNAAEQRSPGDSQSPWPAADFLRGPFDGHAAAEPAIRQQGPTGVPRCLSFDGYQPRSAESKWASSPWGRAYLGERGSPRRTRGHCAVRGSLSAGAEGASGRVGSLQRVESGKVAPTTVQI
ncbi:unnamed protein product [Closterium sp. NIES-64]|nr:unnamed protein product [Closterium sp. NIES-64]